MSATATRVAAPTVSELIREGFTAGQPPWMSADGASIDREVCEDASCDQCHRKGLECLPFYRRAEMGWEGKTRQYRVLAVCRSCGHTTEF